jgi:hypothetical protein
MNNLNLSNTLNQIRAQSSARYATITPAGVILPQTTLPYNPFTVNLVTYGPARTRYLNKRPLCRSLNGTTSANTGQSCNRCDNTRSCTPQIALDVMYNKIPFRFMLAFTSANNFLALSRILLIKKIPLQGALINITIINRGKWGEASFDLV